MSKLVPDPLGGVVEVVEVGLELLRKEPRHPPLENAQRRALRLHDLAVRDDLLLDVRDVADHVLGPALEHLVLDHVELVADLVQDREAVVEQVVEHLVEQPARALGEELLAEGLVVLAAAEEPRHGQQLARRDRDEGVLGDEEVELGRVETLDRLVEHGEVEDAEEVTLVVVVVDLRALTLRDDVLDVERMPAEAQREILGDVQRGVVDVDPGEAGGAQLMDGSRARDTLDRSRP